MSADTINERARRRIALCHSPFETHLAERHRDEHVNESEEQIIVRTCLHLKSSHREITETTQPTNPSMLSLGTPRPGAYPSMAAVNAASVPASQLSHQSPSAFGGTGVGAAGHPGQTAGTGCQWAGHPAFLPHGGGWPNPQGHGRPGPAFAPPVNDYGRIYATMLNNCHPDFQAIVRSTCNRCFERGHKKRSCPNPPHRQADRHPHGGIAFMLAHGVPLPP